MTMVGGSKESLGICDANGWMDGWTDNDSNNNDDDDDAANDNDAMRHSRF